LFEQIFRADRGISDGVKVEISADRRAGLADTFLGSQIDLLFLTLRHNRSTKILYRQAPLPSMLIAMPDLISRPERSARGLRFLPASREWTAARHNPQSRLSRPAHAR